MSGGMADPYKLTKDNQQNVDNFFNFIQAAILRGSLLACAINVSSGRYISVDITARAVV